MTPCIEWPNARHPFGYGRRWVERNGRRENVYVHRWVWEQVFGTLDPGIEVMHKCDNPPCFRLDHLTSGTRLDNARDMAAKGRSGRGNRPRRSTCRFGHPIKEVATHRYCPTCQSDRRRERTSTQRKARRNGTASISG